MPWFLCVFHLFSRCRWVEAECGVVSRLHALPLSVIMKFIRFQQTASSYFRQPSAVIHSFQSWKSCANFCSAPNISLIAWRNFSKFYSIIFNLNFLASSRTISAWWNKFVHYAWNPSYYSSMCQILSGVSIQSPAALLYCTSRVLFSPKYFEL